jgi:Ca2+-binding EF-hand superfamily protein
MNKLLRCIRNNNNDERILLDEFCTRLLDWSYFQKHRSWLALLRHAFDEIDVDGDSLISVSDVTEVLTSSTQSLAHRKAQVSPCLALSHLMCAD